jgi:hypothetical protein
VDIIEIASDPIMRAGRPIMKAQKRTWTNDMWGATGRKFLVSKMWTMNTAAGFIGEHLKSLAEYPPSQGGDSLSMKKVLEEFMKKLEKQGAGSANN